MSVDATISRTASNDLSQSQQFATETAEFPTSLIDQLSSLLESPRHRELFRRFLNAHFSVEVLEFWEEARVFAVLADDRTRAAKLRYIFEQYISEDSSMPINIDSNERAEIKAILQAPKISNHGGGGGGGGSMIKTMPIFPTLLVPLEKSALETMANTHFLNFKKFMLSPETISIPRQSAKDDLLLAANRQRTLRKSNTTDLVFSVLKTSNASSVDDQCLPSSPSSTSRLLLSSKDKIHGSPKALRKTSSADVSPNRTLSFWHVFKQKFSH